MEGVIYSLPSDIAMNIFQKKKNVFVKYLSHEPTKKTEIKLIKGMKFFIYTSRANKCIIGEAKIKNIFYKNLSEIIKQFKNRLMLSESEMLLYAEGREYKKAQVFELQNITLYKKKIPVKIRITMSGIYVTSNNKRRIFGSE